MIRFCSKQYPLSPKGVGAIEKLHAPNRYVIAAVKKVSNLGKTTIDDNFAKIVFVCVRSMM